MCRSDENGGAICAQNNCQNLEMSKVCSLECSAAVYGQFLYAKIENKYSINITLSVLEKYNSTSRCGIIVNALRFDVSNSNFTYLDVRENPSLCCDSTKNGCKLSYTEIANNACSIQGILSIQEVDSTEQNVLQFNNIINNSGLGESSIINVHNSQKNLIQNCNIFNNQGESFLISLTYSSQCTIESCHIQDTYGGSANKICNEKISFVSTEQLDLELTAVDVNLCIALRKNNINSKFSHNFKKGFGVGCISLALWG